MNRITQAENIGSSPNIANAMLGVVVVSFRQSKIKFKINLDCNYNVTTFVKDKQLSVSLKLTKMTKLSSYNEDGANYQAKAVLAFIQRNDIEESYNKETRQYEAEPKVARWENCREQGYVISLRTKDYSKQLNIAFFEHRNSDNICAIKWEQLTTNSPTIDTAEFGEVYKTKWDTSFECGYGEIITMSDWIQNELNSFWELNTKKETANA